FLSYLPLSHIAERQLVGAASVVFNSEITFAESMATLPRDMKETVPSFFFGPPRVWEQLQQLVLAVFGGQEALDAALAEDEGAIGARVQELLGFQESDYLLTAAAPTPPALIKWFGLFGVTVMEGFGQTEAMGLIANSPKDRRIGSLGKVLNGVEARITEEGELVIKSDGLSPGYYNMPEKTAETFVDGWIHTGDKARIDEDGFVFLTGRVKDYFKTIQGKFVAPVPIEADFAESPWTEQQCLLGRGYSKTVMACVLVASAAGADKSKIEADLRATVEKINSDIDKHARIGAIIISTDSWTIESGILTPTLKIKRESVEARFGERAQELALESATTRQLMVEWQ
ncbi:MAG: long-chain acyl-CoA synthetase, partial [Halieaceae bacterium]